MRQITLLFLIFSLNLNATPQNWVSSAFVGVVTLVASLSSLLPNLQDLNNQRYTQARVVYNLQNQLNNAQTHLAQAEQDLNKNQEGIQDAFCLKYNVGSFRDSVRNTCLNKLPILAASNNLTNDFKNLFNFTAFELEDNVVTITSPYQCGTYSSYYYLYMLCGTKKEHHYQALAGNWISGNYDQQVPCGNSSAAEFQFQVSQKMHWISSGSWYNLGTEINSDWYGDMAGSLKFTLADFSIVKNWNMPRSETYEQLFGRSVQELSNLCPQILPILELENSSYFSKNEQLLRSKIPSLTATYENFLNQTDFLDNQTQLQQIGLDQAESTYSNWKNVAIAVPICATAAGLVIGWYIPGLIGYLKSTPKTDTSPM